MSQIIDINVTPTIQDVTINTVENVTVINVNTITGGGGGIQSVQAGDNIDIDNTDPLNPIINATIGGISIPFHPIRLDFVDTNTFTLPDNVKAIDVRPNGTSSDIDFTQIGNQLTYNGTMVVGDFLIVVGIYTNVPIGTIPNLNAVTNQGSNSDVNIQTPNAINPQDLTPLAQVQELISAGGGGGAVTADNVTETSTRVFVTPSEKTAITHSNRSILDAITESFTTFLKNSYDIAVTHVSQTNNPHNVTKSQVGLSNVDNTTDLLKPISTATQNALNLKANLPLEMTLASDFTLTSTVADQKLFNVGANGNGAFDLKANTTYEINGYVSLTDLSTTTSNFSLVFLGTAGITLVNILTSASKQSFITGSFFSGIMKSTAAYQVVTNSVQSTGFIRFFGEIRTSTAGTFIPAIRMSVAAAAKVEAGSSVTMPEKGSNTFTHTSTIY